MHSGITEIGDLLIVDDNPGNLKLLFNLLNQAGFEIRVARNGEQAIETVKYDPPDLILLDVMMPGIDGFETCQQLKANRSSQNIPIIFMTSLNETVDKVKGLNLGAVDYITKPFQQEEVLARIRLHMKNYLLRKKLEEQNALLQTEIRYRQTAENANQAKSKFLAQMSHELRTPLNIILGFTQIMNRDQSINQDQRENLEMIRSSGGHLLELIEDILQMSKIETGKISFHPNSFDLYYLLEMLEEMVQVKAAAKGLQITFDRNSDVPQYIQTDEGKLRQVLINLLDNAIKFTPAGRVTLRVRLEGQLLMYSGQRKIAIAFEVEDTGPGIAPEEVEELFQPFVQNQSNQEFQSGTGLGLPISREFVRMMGGEITVSKAIGDRGTKVKFDIQVRLVSSTDVEEKKQISRVIGIAPEQPAYRILVVDDQWENRKLLFSLFSSVGLEVKSGKNGREAVALWSEFSPHLIWMDMQMPEMNGYEATQQIKSQLKGQATVIIAMTSHTFAGDRASILEAGCDDFIQKPFHEATLFEKVAEHLGVSYIYEKKVASTSPQTIPELTASDLKGMPVEWLEKLEQATLELDDERIFEIMEKIPESKASILKGLDYLVQNFRFDKIMDLVQEAIASEQ